METLGVEQIILSTQPKYTTLKNRYNIIMQKIITKTIILLAVLTLALSVNYIFAAWVGPTQAPPGGNTPTPVHVGTTAQVKDGGAISSKPYCNRWIVFSR